MKAKRYDNLKSNLCFICNSPCQCPMGLAWIVCCWVIWKLHEDFKFRETFAMFFNFPTIYMSILTFFNIESDFIKYLQNTQAFKKLLYIITIHCFYFSSKDHAVELAFFLLYFSKFFSKGQILNANNVLIAVLSWQF